eukprot:7614133-Ditylum_brightwellii.AAC.1
MVVVFASKGIKDVDDKDWVVTATEGTGRKGSGKKDSAQSMVPSLEKLDSVLDKAKPFNVLRMV